VLCLGVIESGIPISVTISCDAKTLIAGDMRFWKAE
jgi:hypothetical protein